MIHYSSVIDKKAQRILKDRQFLKDCLEAGICPKCGTLLGGARVRMGMHYENFLKCYNLECNYTKSTGMSIS